jgi:hypothetical protein
VIPINSPEWTGWLVVLGSIGIGALCAALAAKNPKIGVIAAGLTCGVVLGFFLYDAFIYQIQSQVFYFF